MVVLSHNHANYQARLDYIQQLLLDHLGLSSKVSKQTSCNRYYSYFLAFFSFYLPSRRF